MQQASTESRSSCQDKPGVSTVLDIVVCVVCVACTGTDSVFGVACEPGLWGCQEQDTQWALLSIGTVCQAFVKAFNRKWPEAPDFDEEVITHTNVSEIDE